MSDLFSSTDLRSEFDRLHRGKASVFARCPGSLRAMRSETSPRPNIDSTDDSVGIMAFATGRAIGPAVVGGREDVASPAGFRA
jgi:HSP20 family protein